MLLTFCMLILYPSIGLNFLTNRIHFGTKPLGMFSHKIITPSKRYFKNFFPMLVPLFFFPSNFSVWRLKSSFKKQQRHSYLISDFSKQASGISPLNRTLAFVVMYKIYCQFNKFLLSHIFISAY
jgi:hypothetical protein